MNTLADTKTGIEILYRGRDLYDIGFDQETVDQYNAVAHDLDLPEISSDQNVSKQFNIPDNDRDWETVS